jgi:ATP-binding cassette subfamily B protein
MGSDNSRALDMRVYRQDIICKNYNDRDMGFTPKSQIAKWARGPMGALNASSAAVSHIFTALIYIFVCLKSWSGAFGVGSVTQYIGAITALSGGVSSLISFFGGMRNNAPYLRTTFEFLDIPNAMYQGSLTTEKRSDKKYEIEFCNVGFKYPSSDEYALKNVSLKFKIGQRLAVVGQNGSGKTTFIKLLCRLYDPTEGEILLNGIDIRKYDYLQYMDIFSVVFQDFKLLSFSLGQNVAASSGYDSGKAEECLNKVGFGERLQAMNKSLETCLYKDLEEDGVEISGGEAQKIALARALYKDAPFIVLDEPTAALDPVAEFEVYSKMNEIAGDKTAVFISHRLSSCRFCQDIAVFHEGELIQRGSHDALLADETGKYHELWNAQAQYYQKNKEHYSV